MHNALTEYSRSAARVGPRTHVILTPHKGPPQITTLCGNLSLERGILHFECAFLGFCACVGLWFMERGINITIGVRLSWFLRFCWFMVYRTRRLSCRADRTDRTHRNALCPDVIMRCTLRMFSDRTDRTNRNFVPSCNNEMHAPYVLSIRTVSNSDGLCRTYGPLTALNGP